MANLTLNHAWAAAPKQPTVVSVHLKCPSGEQWANFDSPDPDTVVLTADEVCMLHEPTLDSNVVTEGDCGEFVDLTGEAVTCNYTSVYFDTSVPTLNAWGVSMLAVTVALVAAWWLRK